MMYPLLPLKTLITAIFALALAIAIAFSCKSLSFTTGPLWLQFAIKLHNKNTCICHEILKNTVKKIEVNRIEITLDGKVL